MLTRKQTPHLHPRPSLTVLLVDDEPLIRRAVEIELTALGYPTVTAANGAEALEALKAHPNISLMVTDIAMPGIDGCELARQAQSLFPQLQVILATGLDPDPTRPRVLPVLIKPYSPAELVEAIDLALTRV